MFCQKLAFTRLVLTDCFNGKSKRKITKSIVNFSLILADISMMEQFLKKMPKLHNLEGFTYLNAFAARQEFFPVLTKILCNWFLVVRFETTALTEKPFLKKLQKLLNLESLSYLEAFATRQEIFRVFL